MTCGCITTEKKKPGRKRKAAPAEEEKSQESTVVPDGKIDGAEEPDKVKEDPKDIAKEEEPKAVSKEEPKTEAKDEATDASEPSKASQVVTFHKCLCTDSEHHGYPQKFSSIAVILFACSQYCFLCWNRKERSR